jgi:phosphatidate phosphatase PAH1
LIIKILFQVDIEINGEPVEIQMKLDDTGAAFFVEDVAGIDDSWQGELASPIPDLDQTEFDWNKRRLRILKPKILFKDSESKHSEEEVTEILPDCVLVTNDSTEELSEFDNKRGKTNKKKRRRRNQLRFSKLGSKASLTENLSDIDTREIMVIVKMQLKA